jgi:hypothetical protein
MAILLALVRGTTITATIIFALALLKRLVIVFGFVFAILKFAIIIAFLTLLVSIGVAMIRGWSSDKSVKGS